MMRLIITSLQPDTRIGHADDGVGHMLGLRMAETVCILFTHRLHLAETESAL